MTFNKVMTTKELAEYIKLNEKTVIKMAQNGEIPGKKIGSQWRFHLDSIDEYLQKDIVNENEKTLNLIIDTEVDVIPLSRLFSENLIDLDIKEKTAEGVLEKLSRIAFDEKITTLKDRLFEEMLKREQILSTSVGQGVAIPHPRHPEEDLFKKPNIVLCCSKQGVDFKSADNQPVHLFFMICAPNEFVHVRLLAKISKMLHRENIIKQMIKAKSPRDILKIIIEYEQSMFLKKVK